jgi:acetyltransferase-like isoleucine patch superfamily enzyme
MGLLPGFRSMLLAWYLRLRGAEVGSHLLAAGPVEILLRDGATFRNLVIGKNVTLGGRIYIRIRKNGRVVLGDGVRTGTEVWLVSANDAELRVGENTILNSYSIFNGGHGLQIGSHCIFAAFVYINTSVLRGPRRDRGRCLARGPCLRE